MHALRTSRSSRGSDISNASRQTIAPNASERKPAVTRDFRRDDHSAVFRRRRHGTSHKLWFGAGNGRHAARGFVVKAVGRSYRPMGIVRVRAVGLMLAAIAVCHRHGAIAAAGW